MPVIPGFTHTPGVHCGSTAMRDLLHHVGLEFDEPMCFGLGSGLGFLFFRNPHGESPSRVFFGRTATLERDLCAHLGLVFEQGSDDPGHAWSNAEGWVDRGIPLLLHVELSRLPYYHSRTRFPGHRVVLAGYDDARGIALLADTAFPELQPVTYETLQDARQSQIPPMSAPNEWLALTSIGMSPIRLDDAIRIALRDDALGMNLDRAPYRGIMGMESLAEDLERWGDLPDWQLCAKVGYQNVEVRGTGGACFRLMYAGFLGEVEEAVPAYRQARLAEQMQAIAEEWSAFGLILRNIAEQKDRAGLLVASRSIRKLAMREEKFWGVVLDLVGGA